MRALTVEELEFVSGGWGLEGPSPTPNPTPNPIPDIVVVVAKRPQGMTDQTARLMNRFAQEAQNREMFCNATAQHQQYLQHEADKRDFTPWESSLVDDGGSIVAGWAVGIIGGLVSAIGTPLLAGGGINAAIADRYSADAAQVAILRSRYGCPTR
jgi:hypothetical protein